MIVVVMVVMIVVVMVVMVVRCFVSPRAVSAPKVKMGSFRIS